MTKIDIISGFLGAGKTTFIKKLLQEAISGEQVVLIENEFGEIGIDGGFLKDSGIEIREMNSGCICCSLVGDFGKSLSEVLTKYKPDRIIIEPSGVGKLSDVMKAVIDVSADMDVALNSAVTIVDAAKCKMYMKNFGEFFNNQIENAGTVVLSRTDITDTAKIQKDVEMIREKNPKAAIVTTPLAELGGSQLLEIIEKRDTMLDDLLEEVRESHHHHDDDECCCGHDHDHEHHHHHDDDDECCCHDHDHEHHHHDHDEDEEHEHHHHDHDDECCCHDHDHEHHHHDHDEDGDHEHHHHDHDDECCCGHDHDHEHHHHHHADEVFTSWGMETIVPVTKDQLEDILKRLAETKEFGDVLRAKGMLPTENPGEWLYFDLVPEQYEIRDGKPDYTGKVCVIGASLKEEELNKVFGRGEGGVRMGNNEIDEDVMPVFLINGFLEAGKTQFLEFTMDQEYFQTEGKTLLIVCEEGDTEYDEKKLKKHQTAVVYVDELSKLTPAYLNELEVIYRPERVLLEWNGMWNQDELTLPDDWNIYQQITIIDGSTFDLYIQNMKPLLGAMLRNSELVIVNRCDGIADEKLTSYRRTIRAMSRESEIVLEDKNGEIEQATLEEDLPYDINADVIQIKPEDYGIWYIDCMDQPERYKGKTVEFTAMVLKSPKFPKGQFVPGRMAMTCCEADMTFLGFMCKWKDAEKYKTKEWVKVRAKVGVEYQRDYHGEGPVLYAENVEKAAEIKDIVQF